MTQLYIIRGAPGSGKTTLARKFLHMGLVDAYYEADQYMTDAEGNYRFDPSRLKQCHERCQKEVFSELFGGCNVAVSNTFTRLWEMQPYFDAAKELGVTVTVIKCEGNFGNVHGVPEEKVTEMRRRFEDYEG